MEYFNPLCLLTDYVIHIKKDTNKHCNSHSSVYVQIHSVFLPAQVFAGVCCLSSPPLYSTY